MNSQIDIEPAFSRLAEAHPIEKWLQWVSRCHDWPAYRAALKYGRPYTATQRPRGLRLRAAKRCYVNVGIVALEEHIGTYVEGFTMTATRSPFQHAWITRDGTDAVDVTLRNPLSENILYFGILLSNETIRRFVCRTRNWGPLLDSRELVQVLIDEGLDPNAIEPSPD
jgi:hypothetical protein